MTEMLSTGDPLVMSEDGLFTQAMKNGPKQADGFWFDGKVYSLDDGNELSAFMFASQQAACKADTPCALDDVLMQRCVLEAKCDLDRTNFVREQLASAGVPEANFAKFLELRQAMAAAIASRDTAHFFQ